MKLIALLLVVLITGCATFRVEPRTFDQAMIDSIRPDDDERQVVILVDRTGAITMAGRPTSLAEIQTITSVPGLPEPPAILVESHRETRHKDVRAIMDACATAGIWRVTFKAMKEESQNQ